MPAKRQRPTQAPIRLPIGHYEHNPLFDDRSEASSADSLNEASSSSSLAYAMDMDNSYSSQNYPSAIENQYVASEHNQNYLAHEASSVQLNFDKPQNQNSNVNYLTGPMVIRVRPDGTPVDEDQRVALPRDDDREAMSIGKQRLPTIAQITSEYKGVSDAAPVRRSNYPSHRYYRAFMRQY